MSNAPTEVKLNWKNLAIVLIPEIWSFLNVQILFKIKLLIMASSVDKSQESHSIDQVLEKYLEK